MDQPQQLSDNATILARSGLADAVFLYEHNGPVSGLGVSAEGMNPVEMLLLATALAAFGRSIAFQAPMYGEGDPDEAWQLVLKQMDAPDCVTQTRSMLVGDAV